MVVSKLGKAIISESIKGAGWKVLILYNYGQTGTVMRGMVAAKLANMVIGDNQHGGEPLQICRPNKQAVSKQPKC